MKLGFESVEPVRELLVKILRIDADFKLPCDPSLLQKQNHRNNDGNDGPSSSSNNPTGRSSQGDQQAPAPKRFRSSNSNQGQRRPNCHNGPQDAAPMSPPHELSNDFSEDEEVRVITPPPKTPPPLVDLSDNEDTAEARLAQQPNENLQDMEPTVEPTNAEENSNTQLPIMNGANQESEEDILESTIEEPVVSTSEETSLFEGLHLTAAPKIITKKTAARLPKKQYFAVKSTTQVPKAPGFIAKSTGKRKRKRKNTPEKTTAEDDSTISKEKDDHETALSPKPVQQESVVIPVANGDDFIFNLHGCSSEDTEPSAPARRSSRTPRKTYVETLSEDELDEFAGQDDYDKDPIFDPSRDSTSTPSPLSFMPELPPPLPEAPEPGCVIYRGEWTKKDKVARIKSKTQSNTTPGRIKKYHPNLYNITDRTLKDTHKHRSAPKGIFNCPFCTDVFEAQRSLEVHIGRRHNEKAKVPCPENCGTFLTCKSAIAKHLLSHRPREQWPYRCEFCGMQFQAKSDLPKHWNSGKHRDDPRVPKPNTLEYREALTRSEILPNLKKMKNDAKESILNHSTSSSTSILSPPPSSSSISPSSSRSSDSHPTTVIPPEVPSMFTIDAPSNPNLVDNDPGSAHEEDDIPDLDL